MAVAYYTSYRIPITGSTAGRDDNMRRMGYIDVRAAV